MRSASAFARPPDGGAETRRRGTPSWRPWGPGAADLGTTWTTNRDKIRPNAPGPPGPDGRETTRTRGGRPRRERPAPRRGALRVERSRAAHPVAHASL